jgi:hypothetical protein
MSAKVTVLPLPVGEHKITEKIPLEKFALMSVLALFW